MKKLLKSLINKKGKSLMPKEKETIQRLPIFEKCHGCNGKGEIIDEKYSITTKFMEDYTLKKPCEVCKGTGKKETNMFLEVPIEIPKLKEWWK